MHVYTLFFHLKRHCSLKVSKFSNDKTNIATINFVCVGQNLLSLLALLKQSINVEYAVSTDLSIVWLYYMF